MKTKNKIFLTGNEKLIFLWILLFLIGSVYFLYQLLGTVIFQKVEKNGNVKRCDRKIHDICTFNSRFQFQIGGGFLCDKNTPLIRH